MEAFVADEWSLHVSRGMMMAGVALAGKVYQAVGKAEGKAENGLEYKMR